MQILFVFISILVRIGSPFWHQKYIKNTKKISRSRNFKKITKKSRKTSKNKLKSLSGAWNSPGPHFCSISLRFWLIFDLFSPMLGFIFGRFLPSACDAFCIEGSCLRLGNNCKVQPESSQKPADTLSNPNARTPLRCGGLASASSIEYEIRRSL